MKRVSVVVPYYRRLFNMDLVFQALAAQDLPREEFEVVIGAMEHSAELMKSIERVAPQLDVRCVTCGEAWNVARARNLALRQAEGDLVLLLDADMLLPRGFLRRLRDRYFAAGETHAVVGQMLNYDEGRDVAAAAPHDYAFYRDAHLAGEDRAGLPDDIRWSMDRKIPWALCWTAVIALPRHSIEQHALYFDSEFRGWGVEDTEWAYRVHRAGLPIVFADDLWAIHLPHPRDVARNHADEARNFDRFLSKWPCFDVEIVAAFGDVRGNQRYDEITAQHARSRGAAAELGVMEFATAEGRALAIGVMRDQQGRITNADALPAHTPGSQLKVLSLFGYKLPFGNSAVERAYLLPPVLDAAAPLQELVLREAQRVAHGTVLVH